MTCDRLGCWVVFGMIIEVSRSEYPFAADIKRVVTKLKTSATVVAHFEVKGRNTRL